MSAALLQRYKQLRVRLDAMTQTVTEVARTGVQSLTQGQVMQLQAQQEAMQAAVNFNITQPAWPELQPEYALFVPSLTAFLSLALSRLEKLDRAHSSPLVTAQFWSIWTLLTSACGAGVKWLSILPPTLNLAHLPVLNPLHVALAQLMGWLVMSSQSGSTAWRSLQAEQPQEYLVKQLLVILSVPLNCLNNISEARPAVAVREIRALPRSFVPLLCCLAYEQLGEPNRSTPTAAGSTPTAAGSRVSDDRAPPKKLHGPTFVSSLTTFIGNMVNTASHERATAVLDLLSDAAVVHFMKLVVTVKAWDGTLQVGPGTICMANTLQRLISHDRPLDSNTTHRDHSTGGGGSVTGGSGTPSSRAASPTPRAPFPDRRLLYALRRAVCQDARSHASHLNLMCVLLKTWDLELDILEDPRCGFAVFRCGQVSGLAGHQGVMRYWQRCDGAMC